MVILHLQVQAPPVAEITCPMSPRTEAGAAIWTSQTSPLLTGQPSFPSLLYTATAWLFLGRTGSSPLASASTALLTLEELCQLTLAEDGTIYYLDKEKHLQV